MRSRLFAGALALFGASAAYAQQAPPVVAVSSSASASYGALSAAVDRALNGKGAVMAVGLPAEDPNQPCLVDPKAAPIRLAPGALKDPPPAHTTFESTAFWSSFIAYHVTWLTDMGTTAEFLNQPHRAEQDPLYTMFGNRSMAGVLGSVAVLHAAVSAFSLYSYERAKKETGWNQIQLDSLALVANTVGTALHTSGTISNFYLLRQPPPTK